MSPEQCLGQKVDARSDLYSLGAIFYEMLTGSKLFEPATSADLIHMHVTAPVPRLPEAYAEYQRLLDGLLAKRPEDRFQSAAEVCASIEP
jgi:serine/threonine-protein kinase PpkA